jgi:hypothetical protein
LHNPAASWTLPTTGSLVLDAPQAIGGTGQVTHDEIAQLLKANIGKPLRVVYSSGDVERVVPVTRKLIGRMNAFFVP